LRGTFKGPTADLQKVILAYYNEKKEPPAFDKKAAEVGGFGPEVKPEEKKEDKKGGAALHRGPVFAVSPTVAIGGPLAILAMLFPSLFGSPREIMRRWLALLSVASVLSLVVLIQATFPGWLGISWVALWLFMAVVTLLGTIWAWRRYLLPGQHCRPDPGALRLRRGVAVRIALERAVLDVGDGLGRHSGHALRDLGGTPLAELHAAPAAGRCHAGRPGDCLPGNGLASHAPRRRC
jgi:hypothetical protein